MSLALDPTPIVIFILIVVCVAGYLIGFVLEGL